MENNGKRSLPHMTQSATDVREKADHENYQVRRRLTDGIKRPRSRSKKRRTQEFLRRSSTDIQPPDDILDLDLGAGSTTSPRESEVQETEGGYRSDTSDNADDLESIQNHEEQNLTSSAPTPPKESEKPVTRLRRTLSGKFRSTSSNKVNEGPPPIDDTIHKSLSQSLSGKAFSKLLRRTSHIDQTDSKGQSLLHLCCSRGMLDCIRTLIRKGANVNLQDNIGYTPLHCAAIEKQLDSCQLLLETKFIDVTIVNNEQSNVLHYLVRIPVDENNLVLYRAVLDSLIEKGIDINLANTHKEAPIHFACMKNNIHTVAFLLERGADCNLKTSLNETPLHYAVRTGCLKLVRMLMESGADPSADTDGVGTTPIDVAEQYQCADILECFQSIIEEELFVDSESSILSPRVRLNDSTIIHEGPLDVFWENDWVSLHVEVNKHKIICRKKKGNPKPICVVSLNHSDVSAEEGTIISDSEEQLWCFSITELPDNILSFATKIPEEREEWIYHIECVIGERRKLFAIYEKLKAQSKPRRKLRLKERSIGIENCREGIKKLKGCNTSKKLCKFLVGDTERASAALWKVMNMENESIFMCLVKYLLHRDKFEEFLKAALTHEIRVSAVGETLFREMSLCTRMLSCYLNMEPGKEYLRSTVLGLLSDIAGSVNVQDNLDNIAALSQKFLDQILSSPQRCPVLFREFLRHTKERVDKVFPNMTHAVVGGFVFLRFICPSIISPHKFGLTKAPHQARKDAVLITKLLQTVSNGVEFDESREGTLRQLNPFIRKNRLFVDVFFDSLTDPISIAKQRASYVPPKKLSKDEVAGLEEVIFDHMTGYRERIDDLLDNKIRICTALTETEDDTSDENSCVEMEDEDV